MDITLNQALAFLDMLTGTVTVGATKDDAVEEFRNQLAVTHLKAILGVSGVPTPYDITRSKYPTDVTYQDRALNFCDYLDAVSKHIRSQAMIGRTAHLAKKLLEAMR